MRLKLFLIFGTLMFVLLACDAEKEAIQRRSLMMPKPGDLPRNEKFVEAKHPGRDRKMAKKMKKLKKQNKKRKYH